MPISQFKVNETFAAFVTFHWGFDHSLASFAASLTSILENALADLLDQPECDDFTDSDDGERTEPPEEPLLAAQPQIRGQVQRITLRRHRDTGFGFRPAGCSNMTIVASVRAGSSAARHGLKMGDRIHSIITPKRSLQAADVASMLVEFRDGPQVSVVDRFGKLFTLLSH